MSALDERGRPMTYWGGLAPVERARAIAAAPEVRVLVTPPLVSALEKVQHSSALTEQEALELQSLYVQLGCAQERAKS